MGVGAKTLDKGDQEGLLEKVALEEAPEGSRGSHVAIRRNPS